MPIVSIGLDLAPISRVSGVLERHGRHVLDRLFTPGEQAYCERRQGRATSYAGRFAAKEAAMKMLGTGWAQGVRWVDLEVVRSPGQAPHLKLHGQAARLAARRGITRVHLSITHDGDLAAAVAVGEAD